MKPEQKLKLSKTQDLNSGLVPENRSEAEETIKRYVDLVWRIYRRLRRENPKKLTKILLNARFKRPRS